MRSQARVYANKLLHHFDNTDFFSTRLNLNAESGA